MKDKNLIDLQVTDWVTDERIERFKVEVAISRPILDFAGLWRQTCMAWIRREILRSIASDTSNSYKLEDFSDSNAVDSALIEWSQLLWGHKLETIYLESKFQFDKFTCSLIRVKDQYLAFELYNRLKGKEFSFEQLSWQYGEGPEKNQGGCFKKQFFYKLPSALHPLLRKLKVGEVLKPHRLGKWYAILFLQEYLPAQYDSETQEHMLRSELDSWCSNVLNFLLDHLESKES